jgi:hypothetical protein
MVTQNTRTFPATPQKLAMELFVNSAWTDVTDDVRWAEGCGITRGRPNESALMTASNCSFVLKNTSGNYSPRNPMGAYYGSIGRNTPMRLSLVAAQDTFTRTVSNGWGSTDDGWAWTCSGGSASDFAVNGSAATMTHNARGVPHFAALQSLILKDCDISFTVQTPVATITAGSLYAGLRVRTSGSNYYQYTLILTATAGIAQHYMNFSDSAQLFPPTTAPNVTYAANTPIKIRFQIEGQIFRVKAWMPNTQSEPQGWDVVWSEDMSSELDNYAPGYLSLYTSVDGANTNTLPIVFTVDNVAVRIPRFAGEVSEWPQSWDTTMRYPTVAVSASGPLRRLSAGGGPLDSAARRYISAQGPYAYWPLEDGAATIAGVNYANGGPPMQAIQGTNNGVGTVKWAQDSTLLGGGPAPVLTQGSQLYAWIDPSTIQPANAWTVSFAAKINRNNGTTVIFSGNGAFQVSMNLFTDGSCNVYLTQNSGIGTLMTAQAALGADAIDGIWHSYAITCVLSGGNVVITLNRDGAETTGSTALTSQGFYAVAQLVFPTPATSDQFSFAHVAVFGSDLGITGRTNIYSALFGWRQERVLDRLKRLCAEEGFEFGYDDSVDFAFTALMGPQRQQTLVQLLQECVDTDCGELVESRGSFGFHFHTHASLDNHRTTCALSLSGQQVMPPFQPIDDDQYTRNSITVTAPDGSSFRYQKTTGQLSIQPPPTGAGEYDASASANAYYSYVIRNIAGWLVGLGTVNKPRYPALRTNRANPEVVATGWTGVFGTLLLVDMMDKVVVTGMSPSGLYDDAELTVVGMTELLHTQRHEMAFVCVAEEPRHVGVVANAASPQSTDSRMDTNGSQLALGYTSSATSLSVQTTAGNQLWTTAAGDFPFDILVGGERMTVTNITGSSSPQTFTVTRSVNGVVKAQGALTDVRLFRPSYVGL